MHSYWVDQSIKYNGSQLQSLFTYRNFGLQGNSVVAWAGPCDVSLEHMVDVEDIRAKSPIRSDFMLHFIVELFQVDLTFMILFQRLMSERLIRFIQSKSSHPEKSKLHRQGDDIYLDDKKLNISIATVSPVSGLVHFGMNIKNDGTPVETLCLDELGIQYQDLAENFMEELVKEIHTLFKATQKVNWVK